MSIVFDTMTIDNIDACIFDTMATDNIDACVKPTDN